MVSQLKNGAPLRHEPFGVIKMFTNNVTALGGKEAPEVVGVRNSREEYEDIFLPLSPWHAEEKGMEPGRLAGWIARDLQTFLNLTFPTEQWPEQKGTSSMHLDLRPAGSCQGLPLACGVLQQQKLLKVWSKNGNKLCKQSWPGIYLICWTHLFDDPTQISWSLLLGMYIWWDHEDEPSQWWPLLYRIEGRDGPSNRS